MRARNASWAGIGSENTMGLVPGTGSRALGATGALVTVLDAATAHFSDCTMKARGLFFHLAIG